MRPAATRRLQGCALCHRRCDWECMVGTGGLCDDCWPAPAMQPCDDALEVVCSPCRPDEDWAAVHIGALYADRFQPTWTGSEHPVRRLACSQGCGRVAFWLVSVPCCRSAAARVAASVRRLVALRETAANAQLSISP